MIRGMADCTNATLSAAPRPPATAPPQTSTTSGILRPELLARHVDLRRYPAPPSCAAWVEMLWSLTWDLPAGASYISHTLPHPACNLSVERGHLRVGVTDPVVVTGVVTRRFDVELAGRGYVVAAKFRPGGLAALTGRSVREFRDRVVPAATVLPTGAIDELARVTPDVPARDGVAAVADCVSGLGEGAGDDDRYEMLLGLIEEMLADRSLQQVAQVADRRGLSVRSLQRLFDHYVGMSPKWVLARYRMHDAVTDLDAGYDGPLADLAASLGWFDQAHFTRDFVALVGTTPGAYRDRAGLS